MHILLTRARSDAARTAARLSRLGYQVSLAPVLDVTATEDPPPAENWDALVLTSARAIPALVELQSSNKPLFAVGERTGQAARRAVSMPVLIAEGDSASLTRLVHETLPPPASLLHVAGRHRKSDPQATLEAAGYEVLVWEAYEAREALSLPLETVWAFQRGEIDAVLHYSRRSAEIFLLLAQKAGLDRRTLDIPRHFCFSADAAKPLECLTSNPLIASAPQEKALLSLLIRTIPP